MKRFSIAALCFLLVIGAVVVTNQSVRPKPSEAFVPPTAYPAPHTTPDRHDRVIVTLIGGDYTIVVSASAQGPRYSLQDMTGNWLFREMTAEQVKAEHPDLFANLIASGAVDMANENESGPTPLGYVDPTTGTQLP